MCVCKKVPYTVMKQKRTVTKQEHTVMKKNELTSGRHKGTLREVSTVTKQEELIY